MWQPICDKCGKLGPYTKPGQYPNKPQDWAQVSVRQYDGRQLEYLLCPNCRAQLNIPEEKPATRIAERLIDILTEIARETAEEVIQQ